MEIRVLAGRYKVEFDSLTTLRLVDIDVPPGDGPLDLPDIHLENWAWVKMLGKPAAEIEATDLEGRPVRLADFRGKVVLLDFWGTWCEEWVAGLPRLIEIQKRFKDQPLAIVALHDASITSTEEYRKAIAGICDRYLGGRELPFRLLLDRPPTGKGARPYQLGAGEKGSGRTADAYEIEDLPAAFVIDGEGKVVFALVSMERGFVSGAVSFRLDKDGKLIWQHEGHAEFDENLQKVVSRAGMDTLEGTLEEQFGLLRSRPAQPTRTRQIEPTEIFTNDLMIPPKTPFIVKGRIIGPDGQPIAGARLTPLHTQIREKDVMTGPTGEFHFTIEKAEFGLINIKVEAPGLATKVYQFFFSGKIKNPYKRGSVFLAIEPTGRIPEPLKMTVGAAVTGRVIRDGRPVKGVAVGLKRLNERGFEVSDEDLETETDDVGAFRFPHVLADERFWIYARLDTLKDRGAVIPRQFEAGDDGTSVDLGDFEVRPGRTLAGRVVFSDGKAIPRDTRVGVWREHAEPVLSSGVDERGHFEVRGVPDGQVSVYLFSPRSGFSQPHYRLSPKDKCLDPCIPWRLEGRLDRDITDLTILMEPGETNLDPDIDALDPAILADFKEARAGPITGIAPENAAKN